MNKKELHDDLKVSVYKLVRLIECCGYGKDKATFNEEEQERIKEALRLKNEEGLNYGDIAKRFGGAKQNQDNDTEEAKELSQELESLLKRAGVKAKGLAKIYPSIFWNEFDNYTDSEEYAEIWGETLSKRLKKDAEQVEYYISEYEAYLEGQSRVNRFSKSNNSGGLPFHEEEEEEDNENGDDDYEEESFD